MGEGASRTHPALLSLTIAPSRRRIAVWLALWAMALLPVWLVLLFAGGRHLLSGTILVGLVTVAVLGRGLRWLGRSRQLVRIDHTGITYGYDLHYSLPWREVRGATLDGVDRIAIHSGRAPPPPDDRELELHAWQQRAEQYEGMPRGEPPAILSEDRSYDINLQSTGMPAPYVLWLLRERGVPVRGLQSGYDPLSDAVLHQPPEPMASDFVRRFGDHALKEAQAYLAGALRRADAERARAWQNVIVALASSSTGSTARAPVLS